MAKRRLKNILNGFVELLLTGVRYVQEKYKKYNFWATVEQTWM
jgi:hypothetical protein